MFMQDCPRDSDDNETVTLQHGQTVALEVKLAVMPTNGPGYVPTYELETVDMIIPDAALIPLIRLIPLPIPERKHRLPFPLHRGKNPA